MSAENRQEKWALAIAEAERKFTEIATADGNLVTYQREASFALQCVGASEELQKCDTESLRNAIVNVASVGLTINPAMKLAYLVPRKGKACLDISYIGLVKIATDSGGVLAVSAVPVRANDGFVYNGPFDAPIHTFDPFATAESRGDIIGVYALAKLASGVTQVDTLSRQEIDKIRAMSKAKSGPWFEWFDEMMKKSVIKRASKLWPRTERLATAEAIINEHQGNETIIDNATGEVVTVAMPQSKTAAKPPQTPAAGAAHAQQGDAPTGNASGNGGGASGQSPADAGPLKPSQARILQAKLKHAGLTEVDLSVAFPGKSLEPVEGKELFAFGDFAAVQDWITKNAKS